MTLPDKLRGVVRDAGGVELVERLERLEWSRAAGVRGGPVPASSQGSLPPPERGGDVDLDVVLAGGGLSLMLAPLLAERGLRVGVFERHCAGTAHREWNASGPELRPLVESGLFSAAEVEQLVAARYSHGFCRWHGGGTYPVTGVLDHAVDAGALLSQIRDRAEARGAELHDGHTLVAEAYGPEAVRLRFETDGGVRDVTARMLIDGRGAQSPHARADLICPTVGGVLTDLVEGSAPDEIDPRVGEILVTTEGVEAGRQHIWEGFPGRPGETTVYLFYYARAVDLPPGALAALYARFFERLERYKRGSATLVRPTFGYIPGWSRLTSPPRAPHPRCVLVGDAAARQSPLTFCGFGHMLRSFEWAVQRVAEAVGDGDARRLPDPIALPDAAIHRGTGALSMMIAVPPSRAEQAGDLNALLDTAFAVLHDLGNAEYAALLKDQMSPQRFIEFLQLAAKRRPQIYREVFGRLGLRRSGRWGLSLALDQMRGRIRRDSAA